MVKIMAFITGAIAFVGILLLCRGQPGRKVLRAYEELKGFLSKSCRHMSWYEKTDLWLQKKGLDFHLGIALEPTEWLGGKLLFGMTGLVAGMVFSIWHGLLLGGGFFFLPDALLFYLNNRDNEKMLPEIRLIYHALELQIRAGVYVADALTECYAGVQERRLKTALLDLAGAITMKADIYESLEQFQCKFDNPYIDSLCITVLQALESGQAIELLQDISEQVKDMEVSVLQRKKGSLDRSVTFYQLGILAVVLGIVLYACITQMFAAALRF